MGRWTQNHYDQVLVTKIENIVTSIIRRCNQEDDKTRINMSYEKFVESLQEGDSFTTALMEVLVKELADRQTRSNVSDKGLISCQTIESLQKLAGFAAYRRPYNRLRNRSNITIDAAAVSAAHNPFDPNDSPDDDDFEDASMVDGFGTIEGTRMDSSLYDMYSTRLPSVLPSSMRPLPHMMAHTHPPRLDAFRLHETQQMRPPLPHFSSNTLPRLNSNRATLSSSRSSAALQRQLSIRRARNRMSDFNEFASRRRNSQRTQPEGERSTVSSSTSNPPRSPVDDTSPVIPAPPLPRASLFDPPSPIERPYSPPSPPPPEFEERIPFRRGPWGPYASGLSLAASLGLFGPSESSRPAPGPPPMNPMRVRRTLRPPEPVVPEPEAGPDTPQPSEAVSLLRPERPFRAEGGRTPNGDTVDFERDFQEWFNSSDLSHLEVLRERDDSHPSMPTPRSISPPEASGTRQNEQSNR